VIRLERKKKLILLPFCVGLILLFIAWYQSYPLSLDSHFDFPFNHISPLYWIGLPVLLVAFYVIADIGNDTVKCVAVMGVVMSMYSLSYFYYLLPGSDSHFARGLTEHFIITGDLNPSHAYRGYFQWPFLFILGNMATALLGLELKYFEFMLYATMGFLYSASLYVYFSKICRVSGYIAVIAFFIMLRWQFNYQFAPFSLCMALLFLLFMIESHVTMNREATLTTLIIFASMTFIHPFVSMFFVLYTLVKYLLSRKKRYMTLFVLTSIIYLTVLIFFTAYFPTAIKHLARISQEQYSEYAQRLTVEPAAPLDAIAQMFTSAVLISTVIISGLGFIILLLRRKFRSTDHAILISGAMYAVAGAFFPILGFRSFPVVAIPVAFGATYWRSRFKRSYKYLLLILIILFTFVPLHQSYSWKWFQTRDDYQSANFFIEFYNLSEPERILSYVTVNGYLQPRMSDIEVFESGYYFPPRDVKTYHCILYTAGLAKTFLSWNYSLDTTTDEIEKNFNLIFSSDSSFIAINMKRNER